MAATVDHSDRDRSDDPERDRYLSERHRIKAHAGDKLADADAEALLSFLDALDPMVSRESPGDIGTKEPSTLFSYGQGLRLVASQADGELTAMSADELNAFLDGERERLSDNTVQVRQAALRQFLRWYDNGVTPEDIPIVASEPTEVDDRYIFDREEIDAMHDAISEPRDRAAFDLMLYCGQRVRAVLSLRVKDIDLEEGTFYLNTDSSGLKGASGVRPLLSAHDAVSTWMDHHPAKHDPDAYFISKLPDSNKGDVHKQLYRSTILRRLKTIAERAGIDDYQNRAHPHNFRHTFVRWAKVYLDMDDDEIRWMLGQAEGSRVMETTYKHLKDEDYLSRVRRRAGEEDEPQPGDISPLNCGVCGKPLPDGAVVCSHCTNPVNPEGYRKQQKVQQDIGAERALATGDLTEEDLEEIAGDDAILSRLIEIRSNSD